MSPPAHLCVLTVGSWNSFSGECRRLLLMDLLMLTASLSLLNFNRYLLFVGFESGELLTMVGEKFSGGVAMVPWILNQHGQLTLVAIAESSLFRRS